MRTTRNAALVAALIATAPASIGPARADSAPKPPEIVTVAAVVRPDRNAGRVRLLTRAPSPRVAVPEAAALPSKQPDFATSLPPGPMSFEQRDKRAAGLAAAAALPVPAFTSGKPDEQSFIGPPAPDRDASTPVRPGKTHPSSIDASGPAGSSSAGPAGGKAQRVSTVGTAGTPLAPPTAEELHRRAARTSTALRGLPTARKAGAVSTSKPRNPSLSSPTPSKSPEKPREVQP